MTPRCAAGSWQEQLYTNEHLAGRPVVTGCDRAVAHTWEGSPHAGVGRDRFSARWTTHRLFTGGVYVFRVTSDDGVRLVLDPGGPDAVTLVNDWSRHPARTHTVRRSVAAGHHTLMVTYYEHTGHAVIRLSVRKQSRTGSAAGGRAAWSANYDAGDFSQWSQPDAGSEALATKYVTAAASEGLPAHSGTYVAHFEVTQAEYDAGKNMAKVFQTWQMNGASYGLPNLPNNSAGGQYSSWFYLPSNYTVPNGTWTNIFQWKRVEGSLGTQEPTWYLCIMQAGVAKNLGLLTGNEPGYRSDAPALVPAYWGSGDNVHAAMLAPQGKWFQVKANLYPNDRIDWFINPGGGAAPSTPWYTGTTATHLVSPQPGDTGWEFGVGFYGGVGKLWNDDSTFTSK